MQKSSLRLAALSLAVAVSTLSTPFGFSPKAQALAPGKATIELSAAQKTSLGRLEDEGIDYFIDNQLANGLIQDRQNNFGKAGGPYQCSLSATGMGLIAIALATEHKKLSHKDAVERVKRALIAAKKLPAIHGMMPHFFDPVTLVWKAPDQVSTIDSSWLIAGGLWAASYLKDKELQTLADELYDRVDWDYWADRDTNSGAPVLSMGMGEKGDRFKSQWDRINSEAAFMYILAIGAREHALPASAWAALKPYNKTVAGTELAGGDLGLFAFQYSNQLMDLKAYPGNRVDLYKQAVLAAKANHDACAAQADKFKTFKSFWGLSAGDGPPADGKVEDNYRAYAPDTDVDGTAHVMATLSSIDVAPSMVLDNVKAAQDLTSPKMHGKYGFSNINLDKNWVSRDVVGIDAGVAVMALENVLDGNEVRSVWENLPSSKRARERLNELAHKN